MLIAKSMDTYSRRQAAKEWIEDMTERFHTRTGVYLSKNDAIKRIRMLKEKYYFPPKAYFTKLEFQKRSNIRFVCSEILRMIMESDDDDPIKTIYELRNFVDDIGGDCNSVEAWDFVRLMEISLATIIDDLST